MSSEGREYRQISREEFKGFLTHQRLCDADTKSGLINANEDSKGRNSVFRR